SGGKGGTISLSALSSGAQIFLNGNLLASGGHGSNGACGGQGGVNGTGAAGNGGQGGAGGNGGNAGSVSVIASSNIQFGGPDNGISIIANGGGGSGTGCSSD